MKDGGPGDDTMIILNFSNKNYLNYRIGFPYGGDWECRFNSDNK